MKNIGIVLLLLLNTLVYAQSGSGAGQSKQIRVIVFGAHPDDCDITTGGLAALYVSMGHAVKFVSLTNGDMGHQKIGGGELAARRLNETREVARRLGVTYEVLENHDGELMPTLENRMAVIRRIREWKADIVIAPRPNDYHPDHRYTGVLVQDAAYMVIVPNVLSSVPPLPDNPLFLYVSDRFERPNPFRPDITVDISSVFTKKIDALDAHVSQFYEWLAWTEHDTSVPAGASDRKKWLTNKMQSWHNISPAFRSSLEKWYGKDRAVKVAQAEAFEICEYGMSPTDAEIRRLFPMLPQN
ncbi:PIG-L deacetylase family protein [Flavihumibacter fluvii]|uniref:PIG-L deacetylase family protein n=1 Tax=Flavihumibacter fluvii TaxID=2838157 RepID=UPI001BDDDB8A|nr:PIG-L family deacetylase [Flavihumibacter fluvii]ULQ53948.1 PIG-L family deacetylase [Flavihumibacter fluvii]